MEIDALTLKFPFDETCNYMVYTCMDNLAQLIQDIPCSYGTNLAKLSIGLIGFSLVQSKFTPYLS